MCCSRITEVRMFDQLLLLLIRSTAPCLLEHLLLRHLLVDFWLFIRFSALQLLKDFLLHLMLLVRVFVVHLLDILLLLLVTLCSDSDSDFHRDGDSNSNIDSDSDIVGHGYCQASTRLILFFLLRCLVLLENVLRHVLLLVVISLLHMLHHLLLHRLPLVVPQNAVSGLLNCIYFRNYYFIYCC